MSLPDVSKMTHLPPALWRSLGVRLRTIGLTMDRVQEVTQIGIFLLDAARARRSVNGICAGCASPPPSRCAC
jgi:hypothetical protein